MEQVLIQFFDARGELPSRNQLSEDEQLPSARAVSRIFGVRFKKARKAFAEEYDLESVYRRGWLREEQHAAGAKQTLTVRSGGS